MIPQPYFVRDVEAFQRKFGLEMPSSFTRLSDELHNFRAGFFDEELAELVEGCETNDLELALDSLVDLIYIISGAVLLHGIKDVDFYRACEAIELQRADPIISLAFDDEPTKQRPAILLEKNWKMQARYMAECIAAFRGIHTSKAEDCCSRVTFVLADFWDTCFQTAELMGVNFDLWCELWDDVQRANISKVRATRADQSKRGSTFDVVKPEGWVGPDTARVIKQYYESVVTP